jgi:hypothetical protein
VAGLDGIKTAYFYLGEATELTAVIEELEPFLRRTGDLLHLQWMVFESAFAPLGAGDWDAAAERVEPPHRVDHEVDVMVGAMGRGQLHGQRGLPVRPVTALGPA